MKEGMDVSWILTPEQRAAGLKIKLPDERNIDLYLGKRRLANFIPEYSTVESLRIAADSFKSLQFPVKAKKEVPCKTE